MLETKNFTTAILLSFFLGTFGVDRFYLGCVWTGVLKLLTFGGLGIWALIDLIRLAFGDKLCGNFLWNSELIKNNNMKGGACSDDVLCITFSLILGGFIFYIFIFPWLKDKLSNKEINENKKEMKEMKEMK